MSLLIAVLLAFQADDLENVNPKVRLLTVQIAGEKGTVTAVKRLITRLEDDVPEIRAEAQVALAKITGRTDLKDAAAWSAWWEKEGAARFPEFALSPDAIVAQVKDEFRGEITKARQDIRGITTVLAVAIFLFIIVMFFFVGHVSSKIKGWRELVARAEVYVKHGQDLTERTDKIAAELDAKQTEVRAFLEKLRREQEEEIARRSDELGTELAHQLRTELQTLRQKAERELGQTVTDLKAQLESAARRAATTK
jgi:Skp family chaperone for outer membrane proteins